MICLEVSDIEKCSFLSKQFLFNSDIKNVTGWKDSRLV
ncbi:hypothetical protein CHCC20335_0402 [Bacillus paralicheniformis]|nr:hypothetical protein CHCC20335_0402 [Bacillus paralicheniformis]